ncbi:hypothetical protein M408DRAFT_331135, partial [Serendipita vermifera MAFF 305830]
LASCFRFFLFCCCFGFSGLWGVFPFASAGGGIFWTGGSFFLFLGSGSAAWGLEAVGLDLMSGNLPGASVVDTVTDSVGTTSSDPTSFSWTCPPVDFDGPVYSYMLTPNDSLDPPEYSSQFTITSFTGSVDVAGVASASVSFNPSPTDPDVYVPSETDVADASQGAIHLGHQADADSGEELLEDMPTPLSGSDNPQTTAGPEGGNFLVQAIDDTSPDASHIKSADGPQALLQEAQAEVSTITHGVAAAATAQAGSVTASANPGEATGEATRMLVSTTRSASTSAVSASTTRSNLTDSSVPALRHVDGVVRALLFALCVGHFVL